MKIIQIPKRLYKYRPFNANSISEIERNLVFYANPQTFNDPLDCSPIVEFDIPNGMLETLHTEMTAHHLKITKEESEKRARNTRIELRRWSDNSEEVDDQAGKDQRYFFYLKWEIKKLLKRLMSRNGVLSLAQRWNCPLMWSHYAGQHTGICIEYDSSSTEPALRR